MISTILTVALSVFAGLTAVAVFLLCALIFIFLFGVFMANLCGGVNNDPHSNVDPITSEYKFNPRKY